MSSHPSRTLTHTSTWFRGGLASSLARKYLNLHPEILSKTQSNIYVYIYISDPALLAEMLTQAPYRVSLASRPDNTTMDEYMQRQMQERFDKITDALKSMPKSMVLVIR